MISVTILTKDSEEYLKEVLEHLTAFDEVLVYDTGSKDATQSIAKEFSNVSYVDGKFIGFGPTHNVASSLARNDWILSIDSDEVVTDKMAKEIASLNLDPSCVYAFPRHNYYNGKWIRGCGWYPDSRFRLYNRKRTAFSDALVHEKVKVEGGLSAVKLTGPLKHYSYGSIEEFLQKMQFYSTLFAEQNMGKRRSSLCKALLHGLYTFFKSYILKRGIFDGKEGLVISLYNAHTAYYKYVKLAEKNGWR